MTRMLTALVAAALLFVSTRAEAHGDAAAPALVGSWILTVTPQPNPAVPNTPPPFISNFNFELGGTITHHHAVGRDHRPWHERERGELFTKTLAGLKSTLDPKWVLNPGVLLEER